MADLKLVADNVNILLADLCYIWLIYIAELIRSVLVQSDLADLHVVSESAELIRSACG